MSLIPRACAVALAAALAFGSPGAVRAQDTVTLNVRDASLVDVMMLIARQGHMNIVPDGLLPSARIGALSLTGISARVALTALEQAFGLREILEDGYIRVVPSTTASALDGTAMTVLVPVPGGNAAQIVQPIQSSLPGTVLVATPNGKNIVVSGPPKLVERARTLIAAITDIPLGSALPAPVTIGISNSSASELLQKLAQTGLTDSPVVVIADDARNRLLVRAPDTALDHLKAAIALIDTPVAKVTFDVQVLDVQPTKDSNVGILFGGVDSTGKVTTGSTFTQFANRLLPINATINALISEGAATVLARPSVAVANGKTAKILVGEQYPIVITNGSLVGGQNVQFVPIGVQLQLTPTIGADGTITVDLTTTYSELAGTEPIAQYPIIGQRTVQSIIPVRDGEPIVLAGLFQTINSSTVSKVPLLSSIPVFGEIFKNRQTSSQHDEIVFALYPHIGVAAAQPEVTGAPH